MDGSGDYFNFDRRTHKRFYFTESTANANVTIRNFKFRIIPNYIYDQLVNLRDAQIHIYTEKEIDQIIQNLINKNKINKIKQILKNEK